MLSLPRTLTALALFGVSFGYVEAAVVVYLRHISAGVRHELSAPSVDGLFPLIDPAVIESGAPAAFQMLLIELGREAATIGMLAAVALLVTRGRGAWLAAFAVAFGVWDISFYAFLKLLIDWPESLATWDLLFLIPVPWTGPVWSPVAVSIAMVVCGALALRQPVAFRRAHWIGMLGGGALILAAFMWDFRAMLAGEYPTTFAWPLFWAGEIAAVGAFTHAWRERAR